MMLTRVKDYILARIIVNKDGCWIWQNALNEHGYARSDTWRYILGTAYMHRIVYMLWKGNIPDGFLVCHHCDVRNCLNPEHLFLGTNDDNMKDMVRKGRHVKAVHTEESRRKMSIASRARWKNQEYRDQMLAPLINHHRRGSHVK